MTCNSDMQSALIIIIVFHAKLVCKVRITELYIFSACLSFQIYRTIHPHSFYTEAVQIQCINIL